MKKNIIKRFCRKSTLSLLMVLVYLISLTYTSGVYALKNNGAAPISIDYWDGSDNYTSLEDVLAVLEKDSNDYYHITEAAQLHAVIKYNGGGNKYKLDNDIAINTDYEDYADWSTNAPANEWSFNTNNYWQKPSTYFSGTIDGCGHTIYGLYSNGGKSNNGFIGVVGDTTVIKNLNVWYSYVKASSRVAGILIGSNYGGAWGSANATVEGCSVRYAAVDVTAGNTAFGGIIGIAHRKTTISYCSVADIEIKSKATGTDNDYGAIASIAGTSNDSATSNTSSLNSTQAKFCNISNCYAVNVIDMTRNIPVYVAGVFNDGGVWGHSITASCVYTDATTVSCANNKNIKLLVSIDGNNKITTTNKNYPIKTITADGIKGSGAVDAMPLFDWEFWTVAENDYPYYVNRAPADVWDGSDDYTSLDNVLADLGTADNDGYYHIKTPNQLHAVIRFNGGGNKYKLDNDIYLNAGYKNYANWSYSYAPKNKWAFNSSNWSSPEYKFTGTIDGCGYTVYGLYSNSDKAYNGLIGTVTGTTVIKNLNVWYSYIRATERCGVIIGGNFYGLGNADITVDSCSVRYATIDNAEENMPVGGIMGITCRPTKINNCAVADVKFTSKILKVNAASKKNAYGAMGSFVGALYDGMNAVTDGLDKWQAGRYSIKNSYAVNVVNETNDNSLVYVWGVYSEGDKWGFSITANNIYTDATKVSSSSDSSVKLLVSTDSQSAVPTTDRNYPIKTITANSIKGDAAKTAMPTFDWCKWNTVLDDYPTPQGKHSLAHNPTVSASCDENGTEEYWNCIECNKKFSDAEGKNEITEVGTIEAINHKNATHFTEKKVSCTEDGNSEYWYCPDCKKYSTNSDFTAVCEQAIVIIPKTNHTNGKMHYTATSATCEEDGHIEYWHCTDCDKYFTDADCKNEVSKSQIITGLATGHRNPVYRAPTSAGNTCAQPGTIAHWECLDCNKYFEDEACTKELVFIDAFSNKHTPRIVYEKKATCYETGTKEHYECTTCHKYFEDKECQKQVTLSSLNISAIKHSNAKYYPETLSGCTTIGLKEHWYCPDCKGYFSNANLCETYKVDYTTLIIAAHGHITSNDTVTEYNSEKHWQLCDKCGTQINHAAHSFSDDASVYDGSEKRCKCGYGLQKFDYDFNNVSVSAEYGVLDADSKLKVEKITDEAMCQMVMSAINHDADAVEVYAISAQKDELKVLPNGKVNITLPVSKGYSGNVAIYAIDENGEAKMLSADFKRTESIANLELYGFGTFAVVDLGVPYTQPETENNIDSNVENNEDLSNDNLNETIPNDENSSYDNNLDTTDKNENASSNNDNRNESNKDDSSGAVKIFIIAAIVAGFIIVTFGTVLIVYKAKKQHKK